MSKSTPYDPPTGKSCQNGGKLVTWKDLNLFISPKCKTAMSSIYPNIPTNSAQQTECAAKASISPIVTAAGCSVADIDTYCAPAGSPGSTSKLSNIGTCTTPCPRLTISRCPKAPTGYNAACSDNTDWFFTGATDVCYMTKPNQKDNDICKNWLLSSKSSVNTLLKNKPVGTQRSMDCVNAAGRASVLYPTEYLNNKCKSNTIAVNELCFTNPETRCEGDDSVWEAINYPSCYQLPDPKNPNDPFHTDHRCYNHEDQNSCEYDSSKLCDWGGNTNKSCANKVPNLGDARTCVKYLKEGDCVRNNKCEWRELPPTQGYTCWYNTS